MLNELPPRAFLDVTVPALPEPPASLSAREREEHEYHAYVEWIADYLYETAIPLHPRQVEYAERSDSIDPETAVFHISDAYGYAFWSLDCTETDFETGKTWDEVDLAQQKTWKDEIPEEAKEDLVTYEEFAVNRETWERIHAEWVEKQKVPRQANGADVPYRSLLSRVLKRVPDRAERIRIMGRYFRNYCDNTFK